MAVTGGMHTRPHMASTLGAVRITNHVGASRQARETLTAVFAALVCQTESRSLRAALRTQLIVVLGGAFPAICCQPELPRCYDQISSVSISLGHLTRFSRTARGASLYCRPGRSGSGR